VATGVALPAVARTANIAYRLPYDLIRPPGARPEHQFLDLCVRCGECMKVCTTNALQPVMFEAGMAGMFSPRLMPRTGYCEYNCTLCGQVCPTGAIPLLPVAEKQKQVMGLAVFDKKLCLPYAKGESCMTCEEHCPFTVLEACIGCGKNIRSWNSQLPQPHRQTNSHNCGEPFAGHNHPPPAHSISVHHLKWWHSK
jgi:ferredoxin